MQHIGDLSIKRFASGDVKIAKIAQSKFRGFTHRNSMVKLSILFCKRLPEGNFSENHGRSGQFLFALEAWPR